MTFLSDFPAHSSASVAKPIERIPQWLEEAVGLLDQRVASGKLTVPLLPRAASSLLIMTKDDNADLDRLAQIVQTDPTLAAHVLRVANSPLFMSRVRISSIRQAMSRLGMFQMRQMVVLIFCQTTVFRARGWDGPNPSAVSALGPDRYVRPRNRQGNRAEHRGSFSERPLA